MTLQMARYPLAMLQRDVLALFDYNYWANWKIFAASAEVPPEQFTALTSVTWRNLRGTLVHTLDVEQSWRRRLRGEDKSVWDVELPADRFASAAALEEYWRTDAEEMLGWLGEFDDEGMRPRSTCARAIDFRCGSSWSIS